MNSSASTIPITQITDGIYTINGNGQFSSGDPAIDFLMGIPSTYNQTSGSLVAATSREYYAFAQDSWKATSDLTINYGISWDVETPWANHQFNGIAITCWQNTNADIKGIPSRRTRAFYPGDPGCTNYGAATVKWNHFGPRFGLAWSPSSGPAALLGGSGSHDLAIRAGFGVYFNRDQEEEALQNLSSPPFLFPLVARPIWAVVQDSRILSPMSPRGPAYPKQIRSPTRDPTWRHAGLGKQLR